MKRGIPDSMRNLLVLLVLALTLTACGGRTELREARYAGWLEAIARVRSGKT